METSSTISIGIENLTVNEDIGEAIIPITRTGNLDLTASVDYSINDNSARSGQDFIGVSGTLNFAPGETTKEIIVDILDDSFAETDENFNLAIGNPVGAILGNIRTASITITDNDEITENTIAFSQAEYSISEAENTAAITVFRTGNTDQTVSVDYATSDDYARAGLDYTAISGTLTFTPGEIAKTIDIAILDDALPEVNEALRINLSNSVGIGLGLQNTAKLIIEDDDEVPLTINKEVVVSGLAEEEAIFPPGPTAFDWGGDGTMFIAKLDGIVRVFDGDNLLEEPFIDISGQVNTGGQRGLLGLGVHPNFPEQPYVYLAFSYDPPDVTPDQSFEGRVTRLVRYTADPSTNYKTALPNSEVILLETPPVRNFHAAGAIHFGQNGELFFSHGDGTQVSGSPRPQQAEVLQSLDNPFGKLFRIDPITGNGYSDNPFYNGDITSIESKVYSYGLRNPWRFAIHPETGEPFIGDVGWTNWEEINTGKGSNFGWPLYEGGNGISERTTALAEAPEFQDLYDTASPVTAPIHAISHDDGGRAITLGDFYTGNSYGEIYQGALFFADFNGDSGVDALTFDDQGNVDSALHFIDEKFVTQISIGSDSSLYFSNLVRGEIGRWIIERNLPDSPTAGDDFITGTNDNDVIRSRSGDDSVVGGQGNDKLIGNDGDDTLRGNQGLDSINGANGNDQLFGDEGNDRLFGLEGNDTLRGGDDNDILLGGQGDDQLIGNEGDDTLRGNQGFDNLDGRAGNDQLFGNEGNDRLFGLEGNDILRGGDDNDFLIGGQGNDKLIGNDGDDFLEGNTGDDSLNGGAGNDTLIAGDGSELLIGGDGADIFVITSVEGRNFISDFELGVDLLGIPDDISLNDLNITNNWNNTGTIVFDSLGRSLMVLKGINPESLDINRDFT